MYKGFLHLHHYAGWAVLIFGLYAITKAYLGNSKKRSFDKQDNLSQIFFLSLCHLQLLLGLVLYFISPNVDAALANGMGAAMKDSASRFIAVEHIMTMIIAIVLVQVGRTLSKKQTDDTLKHKKALVFFVIGYILILSRVPWDRLV
ncbi:MAG: hypothetical protein IT246_07105 [Bacteroidia bacterium]|nr:hypothetical protein [Bacteroidia bacterium]